MYIWTGIVIRRIIYLFTLVYWVLSVYMNDGGMRNWIGLGSTG